ncbi:MAG: molybdenum cofactor biosynthesis protein A [Lentisphaerae bacterium ADurb.BinA184]|nr:MAG: molybdenum cofactor biosynthesis protein A [Lentisphaerae bacterium ADurb.BinA184]
MAKHTMRSGSRYQYLFGPVPSRRLGRSLGVDLTPRKTCTLDCIYCQLGRTTALTTERREYVPVADVVAEFADWLQSGGTADYITLAGSGEPTLHSRFGEVIERIRERTRIPVALLTNGTLLNRPDVLEAAAKADVVKVTLSAADETLFSRIHRPCRGVTLAQTVRGQVRLRDGFDGQIWLEVFLVWGVNSTPADVRRIAALARQVRPDRVQFNTSVRPPAEAFAEPVPGGVLAELAALFDPPAEVLAEFSAERSEQVGVTEETILAMLRRRPCTAGQVARVFGLHANEASKYLGKLLRTRRIRSERRADAVYYAGAGPGTRSGR